MYAYSVVVVHMSRWMCCLIVGFSLMVAVLLQNLDLTANNRKLLHEGPLAWRIQQSKRPIGMYVCTYVFMYIICACICSVVVHLYVYGMYRCMCVVLCMWRCTEHV